MPKFRDIPQLTSSGHYCVNVSWDYLESHLASESESGMAPLDLDPDFQRGHVWTPDQQIAYVEYILRGGQSGRDLYFNCPGWQADYRGPYVIVDGKQRLNAVRQFLADKIPAFGHLFSEYTDKLRMTGPAFNWHVNNLKTRKQVLTWYLEMNTGGTPHSDAEIQKVRDLLAVEKLKR